MIRVLAGRVIRVGDDVSTDVILPGAYLNITDPAELGRHLLETHDPPVGDRIERGDILVAGRNCGTGSSREHAQLAMLGRGVVAVVAVSFAEIFLRNCVNLGLPAIAHSAAAEALRDGDRLEIDLDAGRLLSTRGQWDLPAPLPLAAEIADAGGLVDWVRIRIERRVEHVAP
ncbi:MAG: LeuD/DmdB family oxidoreductase small subunit [Solirubrobacteraceae bacterium]